VGQFERSSLQEKGPQKRGRVELAVAGKKSFKAQQEKKNRALVQLGAIWKRED